MNEFERLKKEYEKLGTDVKLNSLKPEQLFSPDDYKKMLQLENETETSQYMAPACGDLYVRIVRRPFRLDPSQMIYIVNLDQVSQNLYNDDLYWRSEPVKFCHGIPTFEEVLAAIRKLLDFRCDMWQSKSKVLNIPWDPKTPDFDS